MSIGHSLKWLFWKTVKSGMPGRSISNTIAYSREVWIALDRDKQIVGFLMAEPDKKERSYRDNQALELSYGGVKKSQRGNDIFPDLVAKMKAKGVPLTA